MRQPIPSARDLRLANRSTLLRALYFGGPASRLELSQGTGLSTATVTNVIAELLAEGSVSEAGTEESQGGRPRTILTIEAEHGYFVGVDVGETHVYVELFDLLMRTRGAITYTLDAGGHRPEAVVHHIVTGLQTVLDNAGLGQEAVVGIGIGVPGIVERTAQVLVHAASIGWRAVPLTAMLQEHISLPLFVDNGAKAMAQAEMWFGAGKGVQHLAVVLVGTGIGAGIIANGSLYRGATNSAGEWGHTTLELDGRACRCGSRGCLEAYAGASAILERLRDAAPDHPILAIDDEERAVAALVAAHQAGDAIARDVLAQTARYLGAGIGTLINLFNPQLIVLGGWVGMQIGPVILPELRTVVARYALQEPLAATRIDMCQLGQDAVTQGAATLVLDRFLAAAGRSVARSARPTHSRAFSS
ncbi:MAG TPA: ROK family protein [Ktedonobacterales bacterium]